MACFKVCIPEARHARILLGGDLNRAGYHPHFYARRAGLF